MGCACALQSSSAALPTALQWDDDEDGDDGGDAGRVMACCRGVAATVKRFADRVECRWGLLLRGLDALQLGPRGLVASIAGSGQNLGMLTDASKCSTKKKPSTSHLNFEDCSKNARTRSEAHAARKELESAKQWDSRPGPASPPSSHGAMPRQHVESMLGLQSFIATTVTAARCSQRLCMSHVSSHLSISNSTSYPAPPHRT